MSRFAKIRLVTCVVPLFLVGCAQQSQVAQIEVPAGDPIRISYSVGPCAGTCPVYQVAVEASGATYFHGERHTRISGAQQITNQTAVFTAVQSKLAQWKPETGVTQETLDCEPRTADLPQYTVIWTNAAFQQSVLEHDTGCYSDTGRQLTQTLESLDGLLGVAPWARASVQ